MSHAMMKRLRALEGRQHPQDLASFIQPAGETDAQTNVRIAEWRAQAPERRKLSVRIIGIRKGEVDPNHEPGLKD